MTIYKNFSYNGENGAHYRSYILYPLGFTISLPLRKEQHERKGKQVPARSHKEDLQVAAWKSGSQE
nr:MAG TPA: hypothetical protein [Caudoviricetes sp.]